MYTHCPSTGGGYQPPVSSQMTFYASGPWAVLEGTKTQADRLRLDQMHGAARIQCAYVRNMHR